MPLRSKLSVYVRTVTVVATVAVFVAGCGNASEQADTPKPKTVVVEKTVEVTAQPSDAEETTAGSTAPAASRMTCEMGEECDLGESSVTVTSSEQTQVITAVGETYEGDFVVVEYDYTYGGNAPTDLGEPPFQILDGDGNTYSLNFDATSSYGIENDRSLIYETVQPGVTAQGTAVFEVSPDAEDFTLLIADLVAPQANEVAEIPLHGGGQPSSSSSEGAPQGETEAAAATSLDSFVSAYYDAVGREDWSATYSMLDSESQAAFTEEEWVQKQIARNAAASPPPLTEAVINGVTEQGQDQFLSVTLNYDDGSQETLDIAVRMEGGEYRRHLTESEMEFLRTL
jgi:hypothetical protein